MEKSLNRRDWPMSDHYNGQTFFNPGPKEPPRGLWQVMRWRLQGDRAAWPERVQNVAFPPPTESVDPGMVAITFINHSTFLIRFANFVVLTDPIFSERCSPVDWAGPKRVRPPGLNLADLPRPDVVLVSHNHYDHMDIASLHTLQQRHAPVFVSMLGNGTTLATVGIKAIELDWWQHTVIGPLHLTATPARHFAARTPFDRNHALWGGFMLRTEAGQVLFAGDSGAGPHWRDIRTRLGPPSVALLPIGAYEPRWLMSPVHMNPAEAVAAHRALGAHRSIGMHFGTFQLTDEAIDAPLQALRKALANPGAPEPGAPEPDAFVTHDFGETRLYQLQASIP